MDQQSADYLQYRASRVRRQTEIFRITLERRLAIDDVLSARLDDLASECDLLISSITDVLKKEIG